ncbi:hypothetical protein BASA62_009390 [Batrachochytrium salamandrivorans]|nr:hypothetical protein BASA62_009390 [Batrachochytrium salamandrivorans]
MGHNDDDDDDVFDSVIARKDAVQLGFLVRESIEPLPALATDIANFPNKVGGQPIWLDPSAPLSATESSCGECQEPMALLVQLYTPEDDIEESFHRVVYLFCCKNGACHKKNQLKCFKLFRTQLYEKNDVYSLTGELQLKDSVCGLNGSLRCSACKSAHYCCKTHSRLDWEFGGHKEQCGKDKDAHKSALVQAKATFFEFELQEEDEAEFSLPCVPGAMMPLEEPTELEVLEDDTEAEVDGTFLKFQKRISLAPDQVIRYSRIPEVPVDSSPEPLLVSDLPLDTAGISCCPHCKSSRTFEFQIMPQLLQNIGIDHTDWNALDWGTVLLYTCTSSCQPKDIRFIEEAVAVQNFSQAGMGDLVKASLREAALKAKNAESGTKVVT